MAADVHLLVCDVFEKEARRAIASKEAFDGVTASCYPSRCGHPVLAAEELAQHSPCEGDVAVLGSYCIAGLDGSSQTLKRCRFHRVDTCHYLLAAKDFVDAYLKEGAYLVTPGWLAGWRSRIEQWGFDRETSRAFFHESATRIQLLDTGVDGEAIRQLEEFAGFVGLPWKVTPVGLDFFTLFLEKIILEHRLDHERLESAESTSLLRRQSSDYAMALDLLANLTKVQTEEDAIQHMLDIFTMLFAPQSLSYLIFRDGEPQHLFQSASLPTEVLKDLLASFQGNYARTQSGDGFLLRVFHGEETLGVLVVDHIAFPQYGQQYLNLVHTILPVCGLSINNARSYQQIKRAEEALAKTNRDLELRVQERTAELKDQAELLNLAHDPVFVCDMEDRITFWNRGAEETYGWTRGEALGKVMPILLQTQFPESREAVASELSARGRWEGELLHTTRDGRKITVASRQATRLDEHGNPMGVLGINTDITEEKKLEAQLRQAHKMEALGTLTGGIAHDFNNILAAMIGFAELAKDSVPAGSRREQHLQRVFEAGLRGRELVRQMLTFSRRTEQEKKPLQLSNAIRETMKLLRASIASTISIRVDVKSESGLILGDPVQIQQVLMNLATNAAYAMREKGGVLDAELSDFSVSPSARSDGMKAGLYMKLVVRDTGVGIPADLIDKIFDPFFTTKKLGEGTGLGLSVVHGIVKQHDGYITVESEPGKGSTFSIYFPKVREDRRREAVSDQAIPTGRERVLFVDDEEALMEMGQQLLEKLGYTVTATNSSLEALKLFRTDPGRFDLVITDQTMPDMTGVDLARALMALRPGIPVILATGFSHLVDAAAAGEAGIRAFAMKPLTKGELARTVRKVLDG